MARILATTTRRVERILQADAAILRRVRAWEVPGITRLMRTLTRLGDASTWVVLGLVLLASGGSAVRHGQLLAYGAVAATVLAQALKRICRRPRPTSGIGGFTALVENPDTFSFPSGHTAVAFGVATALAGQGTALGLVMGLIAAGVGLSRVYLGAHYPLDVGVGTLLGGIAGIIARFLVL
jgi:undecaprenyl-diphosphatase